MLCQGQIPVFGRADRTNTTSSPDTPHLFCNNSEGCCAMPTASGILHLTHGVQSVRPPLSLSPAGRIDMAYLSVL
jgi:hypothetical protein